MSLGHADNIGGNGRIIKIYEDKEYYAEVSEKINLPRENLKVIADVSGVYVVYDPLPTYSDISKGKRKAEEFNILKNKKYIECCKMIGKIDKSKGLEKLVPYFDQDILQKYVGETLLFLKLEGIFEPIFKN